MKTGDDLQETEAELEISRQIEAWLDDTEWKDSTTRTGKRVVVSVDTGEVRFTRPTPCEVAQQRKREGEIARDAKVASGGKASVATAFAARIGMSLEAALATHAENTKAADKRRMRATKRRANIFNTTG